MKNLFPKVSDLNKLNENFQLRKQIVENGLTVNELLGVLQLKIDSVVPNTDNLKKILEKEDSIIKFGIDPTGNEIHLGHAVPINTLRLLQSVGKEITLVIGDFTAKIGDPTGRNIERKVLTDSDIKSNYEQYKLQASKFLNMDKTKVVYNSSMLGNISIEELTRFFQKVPMGSLMQRDDFKKRVEGGFGISLAEVFYPLLMALDSIKLKADLEIGGKDQLLNFHITRELMEKHGLDPEVFITNSLLPGITGTGEKMSKSLGNYIGLLEDSSSIYGKIMSIPDNLLELYVFNFVDMDINEKDEFKKLIHGNPYILKKALAEYFVSMINGESDAKNAASEFERKFSTKKIEENDFIEYKSNPGNIIDILADLKIVNSKSDARRLVQQNAVSLVDNQKYIKITDQAFDINKTIYLKIGKRFVKIDIQ